MPGTSNYDLTYPASTGHTRLWEHVQTLAEDTDAVFADHANTAVQDVLTATVTTGATEVIIQMESFTAVAGHRYLYQWAGCYQGSAANNQITIAARVAAGATVTTAGLLLTAISPHVAVSGNLHPATLMGTATGLAAGTTTIGISIRLLGGSGTIGINGAASLQENTLIVVDLGPA